MPPPDFSRLPFVARKAFAILFALALSASVLQAAEANGNPSFNLKGTGLSVVLSSGTPMLSASVTGIDGKLTAQTQLGGCSVIGETQGKRLSPTTVELTRELRQASSGNTCTVAERFISTGDSVRWEIELVSKDASWTTDIVTELNYPASPATRFWTAWSDPDHAGGPWRNPLVFRPLVNKSWCYGGQTKQADYIALPLATVAEPGCDKGISLVFSPEDTLLCGARLTTDKAGLIRFSRVGYRLGGGVPVRFAMDLVAHEADWRGGLRWMTSRYPLHFQPPNPVADTMAGCAAYSGDEKPVDSAKFKKMAFRINWKLSDDFPYMGMFIPPVKDADELWERSCDEPAPPAKTRTTNCRRLNDYARLMRDGGFHVLNYFNVTEFGKDMARPQSRQAGDPELWKDPVAFLNTQFPGAILRGGNATCYKASVVDPGDSAFQQFILEQSARHIRFIPDSFGICIDRMDWLEKANAKADDGVSWIDGKSARSLCISWNRLLAKLGPQVHGAGKVIFVNPIYSRFDLLRQVDGIYTEYGQDGRSLNAAAMMGLDKPVLAWTYNETLHEPDPDSFFQRHLLLGVYPTAPYPFNNHCIHPENSAEQFYLDYGPLLDVMRGKKWVLAPHAVTVVGDTAEANLFAVPGGYALPVAFGGQAQFAEIVLRNIPKLEKNRFEVLHPGGEKPATVNAHQEEGAVKLRVPLKRGCAMIRLIAPLP